MEYGDKVPYSDDNSCSPSTSSCQSNVSSSSLNLYYENEFQTSPSFPNFIFDPYLNCPSTVNQRRSLYEELTKKLTNKTRNDELKIEIKYGDELEKILLEKNDLKNQLNNAFIQIRQLQSEQLINSREFSQFNKLEKTIKDLQSKNLILIKENASFRQRHDEINTKNQRLQVQFNELTTSANVKTASIENLKRKICEQHVALENTKSNLSNLNEKYELLKVKLENYEETIRWYKNELQTYRHKEENLNENLIKQKKEIIVLNELISTRNLDEDKYKNEINEIELERLIEKQDLCRKFEKINTDQVGEVERWRDFCGEKIEDIEILKQENRNLKRTKCEIVTKNDQLKKEYEKKLKKLQILLQVKQRELEDKQHKMSRNNRILIKNLSKETKMRMLLEKQLKDLQMTYNNNSLSSSHELREASVKNMEKLCEKYKQEIEELKNSKENQIIQCNVEYEQIDFNNEICQLKENLLISTNEIDNLQNEIDNLQNEKFHLQRMISDFKMALTSYIHQNQNIKILMENNNKSIDLPLLIRQSSEEKFNDVQIKQLLKLHKSQSPLSLEVQQNLVEFRKEISMLQNVISKRN